MSAEYPDHTVVPKVSAFTETAVLYYVLQGDPERARALVQTMLPGERAEYERQLSMIVGWLWEERR